MKSFVIRKDKISMTMTKIDQKGPKFTVVMDQKIIELTKID